MGLPDAAVKEARDRVRAAIKNCGFTFPVSRITVNLAPANQRKGGTVYDLPILAGILAAGGQLRLDGPDSAYTSPPPPPPRPLWPAGWRSTRWRAWGSWRPI